jgi:hypothetical protein
VFGLLLIDHCCLEDRERRERAVKQHQDDVAEERFQAVTKFYVVRGGKRLVS